MRCVLTVEAAFYDGERVGVPGIERKVIDKTCPAWFPTPNRVIESTSLRWDDLADGDVVLHGPPEHKTICIRDGDTMRVAPPGTWIALVDGKLYPLSLPPGIWPNNISRTL